MMSRQKTLGLVLYGLAFLVVVTYFIGCFEPDNLRMKTSLLSSSDDSERALNYYRHSQWKTNEELSRESAQKHTHGTFCTIWLIAAIILPIGAVGHSVSMFVRSEWVQEEIKKFGDVAQGEVKKFLDEKREQIQRGNKP